MIECIANMNSYTLKLAIYNFEHKGNPLQNVTQNLFGSSLLCSTLNNGYELVQSC